MTCGSCELSVREEVTELAGVQSVQADRETGRLIVRGDFDDADVRAAVRDAGYRVAGVIAARSGHDGPRGESS